MITENFDGANVHAAPPGGYEEMIGWLHCFHNGQACVSAWRPADDQLEYFIEYLRGGGKIFVSVMSSSTRDVETGKLKPIIYPTFVGTEHDCKEVVSDTGGVW